MAQIDETYSSFGLSDDEPWVLTFLRVCTCVGWLANYMGMIYKSFRDRTYGMALMPLCCNIACEFVYGVIHAPDCPLYQIIFLCWFVLNCAVIVAAIKFAPREWRHAPLVQQNIGWIFALSIVFWTTAHLAIVAQVGATEGAAWSSWFCQLFLSAGCLCQLIVRGSSRGTSLWIWFARFFGTALSLPHEVLRYKHGYTNVVWHSPLGWWGGAAFFILDGAFGILLWKIQQSEKAVKGLQRGEVGLDGNDKDIKKSLSK
ncbi:uncharacterized protein BO97DRAFT_344723 [Aspergillus homomorphus CBS 101889]|uniref:Integral membrane protein n=1 Tax=Aspergillus homomorphus (strain CBS 101889) TaxID=1450537 RepID=A0A395I1H4_ASPHC|nr:hypothetical protein BO97DRAFT_344723 [Aspergillus homomorphus CBS 101889]RAL12394.1 hypothetical protein BO97DRAFT_344723 [Aspergillus homomorphus CBS 101889]